MFNRVITISREFGSGGRTIGRKVAEKLGIPCYDAELIQKIAEESGYTTDYIKEESEYASGGWFSTVFTDRTMGLTNQDKLWHIQSRVIEELAEKGSCVIVGRCADYILRGKADCLNVFIHAGMEKRAERIVKEYGKYGRTTFRRVKIESADKEEKADRWHTRTQRQEISFTQACSRR